MRSLRNPRRSPHQFLCAFLAALMALGPVPSIAQQPRQQQEQFELPTDFKGEVELPPRRDALPGDTTLLAAAAAPKPLELGYAVPNSFLFAALRPAQILNSPIAELYPTEVLQAAALKEVGLDPLALEQMVFALAPTVGGPPSYSVVAKFNKPFRVKLGKATEHTVQAKLEGKTYLQSKDPMLPSFFRLDEQSLLVAPDYFLRNLVSSTEPAKVSNLAAAFAAADRGDDLLVMVDVAQLRPVITMGLSQAPVPPEFASLKQLPNLVKFVEFRANVSRPVLSSLVVTANGEVIPPDSF